MNRQDNAQARRCGLTMSLLFGSTLGSVAFAPQAPAQEASAILDEIVVTAQKREQRLQDVPISISVVSGEEMQERNVRRLEDLTGSIANIHLSQDVTASDRFFVRGIGSGLNFGFEQSVGQVVDGFFYGKTRYARSLLLDVERVEVLRGPQGALIGKNTTAGAINIATSRPTGSPQVTLVTSADLEGITGGSATAILSGPVSDTLRARVAARYEDNDGWVRNVTTGDEEPSRKDFTVRGSLLFEPTTETELLLQYQFGDLSTIGNPRNFSNCGPAMRQFLAQNGITSEDCTQNRRRSAEGGRNAVGNFQSGDTSFNTVGLTWTQDFEATTLTSLTGYSQYDAFDRFDADQLPLELANVDSSDQWEQWTQELRIASNSTGTLDYLAGVFFMHHRQDSGTRVHLVFPPPSMRGTRVIDTRQQGDSYSLFGQATWHAGPKWDITAGLRYTYEEKKANQRQYPAALYTNVPAAIPGPLDQSHDISQSRDEDDFSPRVALQWRPTDDMNLYASASRGFKGGGFDHMLAGAQTFAVDHFQFKSETVTAYEAGLKMLLAERRGELSAVVFYSEYDDLQVSAQRDNLVPAFSVENAASAVTQGVELDARWRFRANTQASLSAAYLDAEYDSFPNAPCYHGQTAQQGCAQGVQSLAGGSLPYSPDWQFGGSLDQRWSLNRALDLTGWLQATYRSSMATSLSLDPHIFVPSVVKIDARLALESASGNWQVALVGRNLTDRTTSSFIDTAGGGPQGFMSHVSQLEPSRTLSLQFQLAFH